MKKKKKTSNTWHTMIVEYIHLQKLKIISLTYEIWPKTYYQVILLIYIYIYIEYLDSDLVRRGNIIYVCMSYGYFFITRLGRSLFQKKRKAQTHLYLQDKRSNQEEMGWLRAHPNQIPTRMSNPDRNIMGQKIGVLWYKAKIPPRKGSQNRVNNRHYKN